jgi:hypothetical protein
MLRYSQFSLFNQSIIILAVEVVVKRGKGVSDSHSFPSLAFSARLLLCYSSFTGMAMTRPAKRGVLSAAAANLVWQPTHPPPSGMAPARK